jgi:hypothetical protein
MRLFAMLPLALAAAAAHAQSAGAAWSGELRSHWDARSGNGSGLLAQADALAPGLVQPQRSAAALDLALRGHAHGVSADVLLSHQRFEGGRTDTAGRFNELHASGAFNDAWAWSAGRKIVSWDVGYAWRPNDVVQQEERRRLLAATPQGRPVLQLERFSAETAWTLVWANPQHLHTGLARSAGAEESALALRVYARHGAADWHGFARWGEHTRGSAGAALAWVANEAWELHGSWRLAQAHDGWRYAGPAGAAPAPVNPWQTATLGAASQWLLGFTWTSADQLSLLGEAWRDGAAPSDGDWAAWQSRLQSLAASAAAGPPALRTLYAANLAWSATPWQGANLRRDNLFLRASWQHEGWQPALDLLYTPEDRGRTVTAALAWQGDRLKLEAGWRRYGGPAQALLARLPLKASGYLLAGYAF